jgi:uncharacterized Zn-finger protein
MNNETIKNKKKPKAILPFSLPLEFLSQLFVKSDNYLRHSSQHWHSSGWKKKKRYASGKWQIIPKG